MQKKQKYKNPAVLIILISFLSVALVACVVLLGTSFLTDKRIEAITRTYQIELDEKDHKIKAYREQYEQIIHIRDQYRTSISDLVELIYNKQAPLAIGGFGEQAIAESDEIVLLEIRNTINTMRDDQQMLTEIKYYLNARKEFISNFPFVWPVGKNGVPKLTSGFGFREDLFGDGEVHFHEGIDIAGDLGDPAVATADGKVLYAFEHKMMGKIIVLEHQYGFTTGYSHLSKILVTPGQLVKRGDKIGEIGNTGKSLGPHLHYEIRKDGVPIDPLNYLTINY